jgi:ribonuclease VapC
VSVAEKVNVNSVLDASALLAYLNDETGAEIVEKALEQGCYISSVNLAEVFSKVAELGIQPRTLAQRLEAEGILHQTLIVIDFGFQDILEVATLRPATKSLGLSLGDRVCLVLGQRLGLPIFTADKTWEKLAAKVTLIR